ncbi:L-fuconolactonase [Microbacteriaceae bacterium SG_E_30_P1]|uniref:L-fuconolactonase n=1 Tax=Antiquaquibacter oligotrophicus TaxID=2880260 RepID=A0ABT6KJL1_9MICO|nr:amidohydrolase family protein [Antiquaquibacter oligotrophicus]MDH6180180.1 L-fuconolactonase [Antiquaquibacter oligotrophicus]UDF14069.1 amidohydrolase family protein [Antiquaquibacter oligotrophicus]
MTGTIDAHVHVWDLTRASYPWLGPDAGALYRNYAFDDIAPTLADRGIGGAVLVQASDEAADTQVMLDAAAEHPEILGVVAWSPIDDAKQLTADLASFDGSRVVGIRNLVHEHPREWLDRPEVREGLSVLAASGLPLDFPTSTRHAIADVVTIGSEHPDLTIVLDHLGKPPIGGTPEERDEWRMLIAEVARNPRSVAKLSGLYAATGPLDSWTTDLVRPFVDDALEAFGAERLLYGGDWPIAVLAGGYERTWAAITEMLSPLSARERDAILHGTAERVYRLATTV